MKALKKTFTIFFILSFCLFNGCLFANSNRAERAAEKFHEDFNAGNYRKIYEEGDDGVFKATYSESVFINRLEEIKKKLGAVKKSKFINSNERKHNRGTDVYVRYETEFANGKANESFTYVLIGDKILLGGYQITY